MLFAWITDPNAWLALGTLTLLEIVLGIDNIIFLSLVVAKLPTAQRAHARRLGCLLYTSPSPRDRQKSRMPSSA